jgi:hypothetical protein
MATDKWNVDSDGTWSTAADWSLKRTPQTGDSVVIVTVQPHTITYDGGGVSIAKLTVGDDTFVVNSGANTLSITSSASFGNKSTLDISSGLLDFTTVSSSVHKFVQSGGTVNGAGTLTVLGPATIASGGGSCGQTGTGKTLLDGETTLYEPLYLDEGRVLENQKVLTVRGGAFFLGADESGTPVGRRSTS